MRTVPLAFVALVALAGYGAAACGAGQSDWASSPEAAGPCGRSCRERCMMQTTRCENECDVQTAGMDEGNTEKQSVVEVDPSAACRRRCQNAEANCGRSCLAQCAK